MAVDVWTIYSFLSFTRLQPGTAYTSHTFFRKKKEDLITPPILSFPQQTTLPNSDLERIVIFPRDCPCCIL